MNLARLLLRNSLIIVGTTAILKIATTALFIITINSLDELAIGRLTAAFAWGFLLSATADLGNRLLLLREAPRLTSQPEALRHLLRQSWNVWAINGLLATVILLPALKLSGYTWQLLGESAIFFAFGLLDARAWQIKYTLRGLHAPWAEAKVTALGRSLFLILGLALWATGKLSVAAFGGCFVAGIALELLIFRSALTKVLSIKQHAPHPPEENDRSQNAAIGSISLGEIYFRILPFGLTILFVTISQRLPLIVMPVMGIPLALTYLGTAIKLPEAAVFLPGNMVTAFLPTVSLRRDHPKLRAQTMQALEWMSTFGVLAAGLLALESVAIFDWIFKESLFPAVTCLPILAVWFGLAFVERCTGALNIALGGERFNMRATALSLIAAVIGCWVLIRPYGAEGAALTITGAAIIQVIMLSVGLSQMGVGPTPRILLRPFLAAAGLVGGWYLAAAMLGLDRDMFLVRSWIAGMLGLGLPVILSLFMGDDDMVRKLLGYRRAT